MRAMAMQCDDRDNVAMMMETDVKAGSEVEVRNKEGKIQVRVANQDIPFGHKIALRPIAKGEDIIKYGECIGIATQDIAEGDYVHVHNLESKRGRGDLTA